MRQVPTYALYGEPGAQRDGEFLHCETIPIRSRLHDFRINPHRHEQFLQTLLLTAGGGTAMIDGIEVRLVPPCLVVMPPCTVHAYSFSSDVDGLVLTIYERQAARILASCPEAARGLSRPRVVLLAGQSEEALAIAASLNAVAAEFAGRAAGRVAMMEAHLAIAWLAMHRADTAADAASEQIAARGASNVARFRELVERDFRSRRPIEEYARQLGVTEVHLRRLCQSHLGVTPLGLVNARILLEARRLLVFTSLGIKEVAAEVGFDDHAYFSRFFYRETGLSPTAFRAMRQTTLARPAVASPLPADTHPETARSGA